MRKLLIGLFGLIVLLTQLAAPAGAGAAPVVTVSPGSGPRGTAVGISATGLRPSTDHLIELVRGTGNTNTVRLFEDRFASNARGELHYRQAVNQEPGQYSVRIVAIGGTVLATAPLTVTPGGIPAGERYFPETGHQIAGDLRRYWEANGDLAQFGYSLTEVITERLNDGKTYAVQYFERARLEYHPENQAPYDIQLGQFGRQVLGQADGPKVP